MIKPRHSHIYLLKAILITAFIAGCLDGSEIPYAHVQNSHPEAATAQQNLQPSDGELGYDIPCIAPIRKDYIAAMGGDPETKQGKIDALRHTILFVFDKSGSMDDNWDDSSKWQSAADAMIYSVAKYTEYVSAGTIFFPTDDHCGVDSITASSQIYFTNANDFIGQWENNTTHKQPMGSTPMEEAFRKTDEALAIACQTGIMERPIKVVLLADGQPTCDDQWETMTSYAQKWREHGVMTFVIGLPGSGGAKDLLEQIAIAGGSTQEIIEKRKEEITVDTEYASPIDTDAVIHDTQIPAVDTSGVISPNDEYELEKNISIVAE